MEVSWELITFMIGITISISAVISKLFMRYLESRITNLSLTIEERKDDCAGLEQRMQEIEKYHVETRVSLANIGKDIEYIKLENNKMSINIEKILNNNCRK